MIIHCVCWCVHKTLQFLVLSLYWGQVNLQYLNEVLVGYLNQYRLHMEMGFQTIMPPSMNQNPP